MNKSKIPTVVGIIVLIIGLAVAVFLLQQQQIFRLGASPDRMPKDVRTTNVNDTSFTISWTTDKETVGFVEWGADENTPQTANEENNTAKNIHSVTVRNASANKTYFFRVNSDGNSYDNNGALWQVKTGPQLTTPPGAILISGTIFQEN